MGSEAKEVTLELSRKKAKPHALRKGEERCRCESETERKREGEGEGRREGRSWGREREEAESFVLRVFVWRFQGRISIEYSSAFQVCPF